MDFDTTKTAWEELCRSLQVPTDLSEKWWIYIHDSYQSNGRYYHTLSHIKSMLGHLEQYKEKMQHSKEVSLAIFFHDIIYEPKEHDNEERSAVVFMKFAEECLHNLDPEEVKRIHDMILLSKNHYTKIHASAELNTFGSEDLHYFLDCDMAILGQDKEEYKKYSAAIRQEYIHIANPVYSQRRKSVLEKFIDSPKIYATQEFFELYEDTARRNLKEEIQSLTTF